MLDENAPAFYVEYLTLSQSQSVTFETASCSPNGDSVLHLVRDDGGGSFTQVAFDDDGGVGAHSLLSYTNPGATADFVLVLRTYGESSSSTTCQLYKNSQLHEANAPAAAHFRYQASFTYSSTDELRTTHLPGESVAPAIIRFTSSGPLYIGELALGNGVAGNSVASMDGSATLYMFGTPHVRVGGTYAEPRPGQTRVMVNDEDDTDGDGVGDLLEAAIQTCATVTGCGYNAEHGRDTDRDGLTDGEELWGVAGSEPDGSDDVALPRFGADPRKKDVFLQLAWRTDIAGVPLGDNPFQWLRDNPTASLGGYQGPLEDWVDFGRQPLLDGPVSHVRNPDGTSGLSLHLDIGVAPLDPADEDKFGDMPRASALGVVPDFIVHVKDTIDGDVEVEINGVPYSFDATTLTPYEIAFGIGWAALLTFEPVAVKSVEQLGDGTARVTIEAEDAGVHFERELEVAQGFETSVTLLDEASSIDSKNYTDSNQFDDSRRGLFRYGVATNSGNGGNAGTVWFDGGINHSTWVHELGHTLGIGHRGHAQWGHPGSHLACLPHYTSMMSYIFVHSADWYFFAGSTLSDQFNPNLLPFNPAAPEEVEPFGPSVDHSTYLSSPFTYTSPTDVDQVDWNRDGVITSGTGGARRSVGLAAFDGETCEAFTEARKKIVLSADQADGSPDLVRLGSRLYLVWSTQGEIRYKYADLDLTPGTGNKSCTEYSDPYDGYDGTNGHLFPRDCVTWSSEVTVATESAEGVSAMVFGGALYIASRSSTGAMKVRNCGTPSGAISVCSTQTLPSSSGIYRSVSAPELMIRHVDPSTNPRSFALVYLDEYGSFRSYGLSGGSWTYEGTLLDQYNSPISGGLGVAGKDWPDQYVSGWTPSDKRSLAVLPSSSGAVRVFALNYSTGRWAPIISSGFGTTYGKPFIEYRTVRDEDGYLMADFDGHFMIGWMDHENRARVALSTMVDENNPPSNGYSSNLAVLTGWDYLRSTWSYAEPGTSVSLYSDSSLDNVFGIAPLTTDGGGMWFYPHADGSPDHAYEVDSDFRIMEDYTCWRLAYIRNNNSASGADDFCGVIDVLD